MSVMSYIGKRLKEPSTWRGLIWVLASAVGITMDDATALTVGAFLAGLVGVALPDEGINTGE